MLELVISACLLDDDARCKEVSLTHMGESVTPVMCMVMSPAEIAKWTKVVKQAAAELGIPIEWGGDWRTFKDGPHWQLPWAKYP